jgi:ribosome biogenesis GTPase
MAMDGQVEPIILLTKVDLISDDLLNTLIKRIRDAGIEAEIIPLSNVTGTGVDQIQSLMKPGTTSCLVGSSGVGKSTLINSLSGNQNLPTNTVSESGEGRHTTVSRQLLLLENRAMLIDTPGMRELGVLSIDEDVDESFPDIQALIERCKFSDCSHEKEPGCAIQSALKSGDLDGTHYRNYLKIKKESEFNELSYREKKRKDKSQGKMIKDIMKHKKR